MVAHKREDADIVDTADEVRALVERTPLPAGVEAVIVRDESFMTRNRLELSLQLKLSVLHGLHVEIELLRQAARVSLAKNLELALLLLEPYPRLGHLSLQKIVRPFR